MKKFVSIFLIIFILSLSVPAIVSAAWWNPFTWFSSTQPAPVTPQNNITNNIINNSPATKKQPSVLQNKNVTSQITTPSPSTVPTKSNNQICQNSYGTNSVWAGKTNSQGGLTCECQAGYVWNLSQTSCITYNESCAQQFPNAYFSGQHSANGQRLCNCISGYVWNSSGTACVSQPSCPSFSSYNSATGQCQCNQGYISSGGICESALTYCQQIEGYGATYDYSKNSCACTSGYIYNGSQCVSGYSYCSGRWGAGAQYNYSTGSCECGMGYRVNSSGTACVYSLSPSTSLPNCNGAICCDSMGGNCYMQLGNGSRINIGNTGN